MKTKKSQKKFQSSHRPGTPGYNRDVIRSMATRRLSVRKLEAIRFLWQSLLDSGLPIMSVEVLEKLSIEAIHTLSFQFVGIT
jgi:hypothetical protein